MRPIRQDEAEEMREALRKIAGFYNPGLVKDAGQAAALEARTVLDKLGLLSQDDAQVGAKGRAARRMSS